jgi:uncharacterized protein YkwD
MIQGLISIFIALSVLGGVVRFQDDIKPIVVRAEKIFSNAVKKTQSTTEKITNRFGDAFSVKQIKTLEETVFVPPPLKQSENKKTVSSGISENFDSLKAKLGLSVNSSQSSILSVAGILKWTNEERTMLSGEALTLNSSLNTVAETKLRDMFEKQYFEHISPSGKNVDDLAKDAGYTFVIIGENLALGNFKDDKDLVAAWMASPGHRANILNFKFKEIGIAVGNGLFEGKKQWLAVQTFGSSLANCPDPNQTLKQNVESNKYQVDEMNKDIQARKYWIDQTDPSSPSYNLMVEDYNRVIASYNNLIATTKDLVERYNSEIRTFNGCISAYQ